MYVSQPTRGIGAISGGQYVSQAGAAIMAGAAFTGPAAPFVALGGLIVEFLGQMGVGSGCGQKCVLSTQYANQAEALLGKNIAAYFAISPPRPKSAQLAALSNFDLIWADLVRQCGNAALGDAGKKCISDRQAGSCAYHQPASSVPPWGTPAAGECWNWWSGYRDPISQDAAYDDSTVAGAVQSAGSTVATVGASLGLSNTELVLLAALAALGLVAVSS